MKTMLFSSLIIALTIAISACTPQAEPLFLEIEEPVQERGDHESAELTARAFIDAFILLAPPDQEATMAAIAYDMLSTKAKSEISSELPDISSDLALFVGVQDVPDQGFSTEDLQAYEDNTLSVILGLNYSESGPTYRSVNLVWEDNDWKVDSITTVEKENGFE